MTVRFSHVLRAFAIVGYLALGWLVGLALVTVAVRRAVRRFRRMRVALAPTIACEWCDAAVPQYGPYACGSCGCRTLGWAWRCSCGAWAGHIRCTNQECGLSIRNPLLAR